MDLQPIMDRMAEHFRPDAWSLLLVDEATEELYFSLAVGSAADSLKDVRLKLGEGIAGWVAKHGERLIIPDVYTDPRFAKRIDEMTKWETRSIICVPLISKNKILGVIQLINVDKESFSDHELFFLQGLCENAAAAIENARELENRGRTPLAGASKTAE
jgi:GAF domain-containing protein